MQTKSDRMILLENECANAIKELKVAEAMYRVAIAERNYERSIVDRLKEENAQLREQLKSTPDFRQILTEQFLPLTGFPNGM